MAFSWKGSHDIWKGEGIYHLTWVVAGRRPLLGTLEALSMDVTRHSYNHRSDITSEEWERMQTTHLAHIKHSALGFAVSADLNNIGKRHEGVRMLGKIVMEDHIHAVIYVQENAKKSIRQIGHGFRIGITHIARDLGVWPPTEKHSSVGVEEVCHTSDSPGLILDRPFIRTLSRKGQLDRMIKYVHANPDNAWMRRLHPELYTIRRNQEHGGLLFDTMGKARLLDYPERNVVALSRTLTKEQIADEVQKALWKAEQGAVTYCAAINDGERSVTKAIREGGYPLVVMMLDGFPPEGSEAARYFHPGGAYHKICGEGLLYLMAPLKENYENERVIAFTNAELKRKAEEKGYSYKPLAPSTTRWRMIAGNMMLEMISNRRQ